MKRLILNADDLGLTGGVNRAVRELHEAGALTSATLMASSDCYNEAAAHVLANPSLGVGCHILLVDGLPVSPASEIPTLIDPATGELRATLGAFVTDLLRGRIRSSEIEVEVMAQIRKLQANGIEPTHVDTHKHTHLFPAVLEPVLRGAHRCGVKAIRNPFEPDWSLKITPGAPWHRQMAVKMMGVMRHAFRRLIRKYRFATTDGTIGMLATGTLDADTLQAFIKVMPEGTWELCCHPGYNDEALAKVRTRLFESRDIERVALLASRFNDIELISFKALHPPDAGSIQSKKREE